MQNIKIIYKNVKYANLKVKPTQEVILTVPFGMSGKEIEQILHKRQAWIEKHLAFFCERVVVLKERVSGEDFFYLGRIYQLKVIESSEEKTQLTHSHFELYVKDQNDDKRKEQLIDKWYRSRAEEQFIEAMEKFIPIVQRPVNRITIRPMKTRWGSCNHTKGYINLNQELIKKPYEVIEYVVLHELAHLIHPNHSRAFYNYLSRYMPDWRERSAKLKLNR